MDNLAVFGLQLAFSLFVYTLLARWYVSPWLADKPLKLALTVLVLPHVMRHIGLTFFVDGVIAAPLPSFFAYSAAYGDLLAAVLAIVSLFALRGNWRVALPLVWMFNTVGFVDLLNALRQAEAVPALGGTWYIPTFFVPLLLVTHVMIFARLLREQRGAVVAATQSGRPGAISRPLG
jgi:hypothetical protein